MSVRLCHRSGGGSTRLSRETWSLDNGEVVGREMEIVVDSVYGGSEVVGVK